MFCALYLGQIFFKSSIVIYPTTLITLLTSSVQPHCKVFTKRGGVSGFQTAQQSHLLLFASLYSVYQKHENCAVSVTFTQSDTSKFN